MSEPSSSERPDAREGPSRLAIGAILVIVGVLLFVGQIVDVGFADLGWPFFVIAAGVALLLVGLLVVTESAIVAAGTVVSSVGLLLLYQNATGHWVSWAYAWALVGPAAGGLGMLVWGVRSADPGAVRNGFWGLLGGLALFAVGFLFFEAVIGISGRRLPLADWTLPVVIIAIGVVVLVRGLMQGRGPRADAGA